VNFAPWNEASALKYEFQKLADPSNEAELKLAVPENLAPV
jgi:hypothetical protein